MFVENIDYTFKIDEVCCVCGGKSEILFCDIQHPDRFAERVCCKNCEQECRKRIAEDIKSGRDPYPRWR